jgi:hypothetical protein
MRRKRKVRRFEDFKREVLKPHAVVFELDPAGDYCRPGNRPVEAAFEQLSCGFDLLVEIFETGFPSAHRSIQARGLKYVQESILRRSAPAARLLAHAVPTLLDLTGGRLTLKEEEEPFVPPEVHLLLRKNVEDFYPLKPKGLERPVFDGTEKSLGSGLQQVGPTPEMMQQAVAEFKVLEEGQPREQVTGGYESANAFSSALMRGEDPQKDPELIELQRVYARDYFIHRIILRAVRLAMDRGDFQMIRDKVIRLLDPDDPKGKAYSERALATWIEGSRSYEEYASIALPLRSGVSEAASR